jgi:hypothetical protein
MRTIRDILEELLHDEALRAQTHGNDRPSFMVELVEDDAHPLALLSKRVRHRHTDLVERHERRTRRSGIRGLDRRGRKPPSQRSTRMTVYPPLVFQPTVK